MKLGTVEAIIARRDQAAIPLTDEAAAALHDMQSRLAQRNPVAERATRAVCPANYLHINAMLLVMEETARLAAEGHTVVGLEIRAGRPVIELSPSSLLARLANAEEGATYIAHGLTGGVRRRTGELLRRACRVIWIEQGD